MRTSEWVIVAYFAYLLAAGSLLGATARTLGRVALFALLFLLLLAASVSLEPSFAGGLSRDWLPGLYLLLGYWSTGLLYRGPDAALEDRLAAMDGRLFSRLGPLIMRVPRAVLETLEFAYLCCYPMVPAGLAFLYASGQRVRTDRYWTVVLIATFAAYGALLWEGTRPPRALGRDMWITRRDVAVRRLNLRVLERGSIQVNTFPSGHAAAATAVALFMMSVPGGGRMLFAVLAVGIAVGAIVGRYHYAADVVAGMLVAAATWLLVGIAI